MGSQLKRLARRLFISEHMILCATAALFLALWPALPHLGSARNLNNLSSNFWPLLALAVGQMFVLILAGIDLSQTAVMAFVSVAGGFLMTSSLDPLKFAKSPLWGWLVGAQGGPLAGSAAAPWVAVAVMIALGGAIGFLNGWIIARLKMPAFMVTLAAMMFLNGLAIYLAQSENITALPESFSRLSRGSLLGAPIPVVWVGALALLAHLALRRSLLGRWIYACGQNPRTAAISGVPVERVTMLAYTLSGACAAVASVLYSARIEGGRPTLGDKQMLDVIGAAVIGGISLMGGKGSALSAVYGVLFFTLVANILNMLNLPGGDFTLQIIKGGIILLAAGLDVLRSRMIAAGEPGARAADGAASSGSSGSGAPEALNAEDAAEVKSHA